MELSLKKKIPLMVLAFCIFFAVVFAETISADHDHDCIGTDCPICLLIEAGNNFLKILKLSCLFLFTAFLSYFTHIFINKYVRFNTCHLSPVTLKVRFNS